VMCDLPYKIHLMEKFSFGLFVNNLPVQENKLLDSVVFGRHGKTDDGHEKLREVFSIDHVCNDTLQGSCFFNVVSLLQVVSQTCNRGRVRAVVVNKYSAISISLHWIDTHRSSFQLKNSPRRTFTKNPRKYNFKKTSK